MRAFTRKNYFIYILTNESDTLYIGVTNNLKRRLWEHEHELVKGFTQKYHIHKLIYYEIYDDIEIAIEREKQLKNWNRKKKISLIKQTNPNFNELVI